MGVVAVRALDFALPYRVAGLSQQLGPNVLMAPHTNFRLGGLCQVLDIPFMNTVAVGTCKPPGFVLAAWPHDDFAFGMARQAYGRLLLRRLGGSGF